MHYKEYIEYLNRTKKKNDFSNQNIYIYCLEIICTAGRVAKKSVDQIIFEAAGEGIEVRASPQ